jgi:hypothetical protein
MLRSIRSKETSKIAVGTGSKRKNGDNLNNTRREASRHFKNKKRQYLEDKIIEFVANCENKNITDLYSGINEFKRGYQPRSELMKDTQHL